MYKSNIVKPKSGPGDGKMKRGREGDLWHLKQGFRRRHHTNRFEMGSVLPMGRFIQSIRPSKSRQSFVSSFFRYLFIHIYVPKLVARSRLPTEVSRFVELPYRQLNSVVHSGSRWYRSQLLKCSIKSNVNQMFLRLR